MTLSTTYILIQILHVQIFYHISFSVAIKIFWCVTRNFANVLMASSLT